MPRSAKIGGVFISLRADHAEFVRAMRRAGQEIRTTERSMRGLSRTTSRYTNAARTALATFTGYFTVFAAFNTIQNTVRGLAQFESSLARVEGLVGVSKDQVEELGRVILAIGPSTGKTANELADALFFITSAGLRGADALGVLALSAKASAAGLGETKVVADAVTSALNAYGRQNLSAAEATGTLIAAVRLGKAEAESIAPALGAVIGTAAELGLSFQQLSGSIAFLTTSGLSASEATTQLGAAIKVFIKPSEQATLIMNKYGISLEAVRKQVGASETGLLDVFRQFKEVLPQEEFARLFRDAQAINTAFLFVGENTKRAEEILKDIADSGLRDINDAFAAVSVTIEHQFGVALSLVDQTLKELGTQTLPVVSDSIKEFNENFGGIIKATGVILEFVAALGLIKLAVATLRGVQGIAGRIRGAFDRAGKEVAGLGDDAVKANRRLETLDASIRKRASTQKDVLAAQAKESRKITNSAVKEIQALRKAQGNVTDDQINAIIAARFETSSFAKTIADAQSQFERVGILARGQRAFTNLLREQLVPRLAGPAAAGGLVALWNSEIFDEEQRLLNRFRPLVEEWNDIQDSVTEAYVEGSTAQIEALRERKALLLDAIQVEIKDLRDQIDEANRSLTPKDYQDINFPQDLKHSGRRESLLKDLEALQNFAKSFEEGIGLSLDEDDVLLDAAREVKEAAEEASRAYEAAVKAQIAQIDRVLADLSSQAGLAKAEVDVYIGLIGNTDKVLEAHILGTQRISDRLARERNRAVYDIRVHSGELGEFNKTELDAANARLGYIDQITTGLQEYQNQLSQGLRITDLLKPFTQSLIRDEEQAILAKDLLAIYNEQSKAGDEINRGIQARITSLQQEYAIALARVELGAGVDLDAYIAEESIRGNLIKLHERELELIGYAEDARRSGNERLAEAFDALVADTVALRDSLSEIPALMKDIGDAKGIDAQRRAAELFNEALQAQIDLTLNLYRNLGERSEAISREASFALALIGETDRVRIASISASRQVLDTLRERDDALRAIIRDTAHTFGTENESQEGLAADAERIKIREDILETERGLNALLADRNVLLENSGRAGQAVGARTAAILEQELTNYLVQAYASQERFNASQVEGLVAARERLRVIQDEVAYGGDRTIVERLRIERDYKRQLVDLGIQRIELEEAYNDAVRLGDDSLISAAARLLADFDSTAVEDARELRDALLSIIDAQDALSSAESLKDYDKRLGEALKSQLARVDELLQGLRDAAGQRIDDTSILTSLIGEDDAVLVTKITATHELVKRLDAARAELEESINRYSGLTGERNDIALLASQEALKRLRSVVPGSSEFDEILGLEQEARLRSVVSAELQRQVALGERISRQSARALERERENTRFIKERIRALGDNKTLDRLESERSIYDQLVTLQERQVELQELRDDAVSAKDSLAVSKTDIEINDNNRELEALEKVRAAREKNLELRREEAFLTKITFNETEALQAVTLTTAKATEDFLTSAIINFDNVADAARQLGRVILEEVVRQLIAAQIASSIASGLSGAFSSFFGSFLGGGPAVTHTFTPAIPSGLQFAAEGGVRQGLTLVGERGPELVDFRTPSRVYTNEQLGDAIKNTSYTSYGGGGTYNFAPTIAVSGGGDKREVASTVREEMIKMFPLFRQYVSSDIQNKLTSSGEFRDSIRGS